MRIENEIKLGFKDVMFRPKRSTLQSRSQVSLERNFTFINSRKNWSGIPIIAANMDTVGTFEMAVELAKDKIISAIHKHYSVAEWSQFLNSQPDSIYDYIALSTGTGKQDEEKISEILKLHPKINFLCIDVANGYSEHFVNFVKNARQKSIDNFLTKQRTHSGLKVLSGRNVMKEILSSSFWLAYSTKRKISLTVKIVGEICYQNFQFYLPPS